MMKQIANFVLLGAAAMLTANAIFAAATDHGVYMAINCFLLGFVTFALLIGAWIDRHITALNHHQMLAQAAQQAFERAINEGRIEVIPVAPDNLQQLTRY
jgi:hypothetical protein